MNQHAQTVEIEVYDKRQRRAATIGNSDVENLFPIIDNGLGGFSIVDDRGITLKDGLTTYERPSTKDVCFTRIRPSLRRNGKTTRRTCAVGGPAMRAASYVTTNPGNRRSEVSPAMSGCT